MLRDVLATAPAQRLLERLQRRALLAEDILPYGVHRFDRTAWVLKETLAGIRIWCSLDERAISRPILVNAYEPAETLFIAREMRPGMTAVDAGANIGYHALHLAHYAGAGGHVHAFEPLPYLAEALSASAAENGFSPRMTLHRFALDEQPGESRLRHAPRTENFGGGHLAPDTAVPAAHADEIVRTMRLDDVLGHQPCDFIKIDVEGAEPRVLRGARATLAAARPVILSELHNAQLNVVSRASAGDFIAEMAAAGYRCRRLNDDGTRGSELRRYTSDVPCNVVFDPVA